MLDVPENAWIQILQETAVVTCNNSKTAFHLVCVGNEWVGELQNCTEGRCRLYTQSLYIIVKDAFPRWRACSARHRGEAHL